ncbi:MAG: hypothetical protein IJ529_04765 [Alphaproteobacteria bacterium]|nr:hypothetical protein [Alphaproteobacteria bacterium]MBQ9236166.1 hypothetical protein [Alphaproteobacteria bacterium]
MNFIRKNIWTFGIVMFAAMFGLIEQAAAAASVMGIAAGKALEAFKAVRTIIYIVGGFGLVGIAFAAIFGKINWKWFAALAVGLGILAAAGAIVEYATTNTTGQGTGNQSLTNTGGMGDTYSFGEN